LTSTLSVAALTLAAWALLALAEADWASFGVLVLFAMQAQLGFVFIGAQAGRAYDVQVLKRVFSWIVAGFVVGFMIGGFAAARFAILGGSPVHLLAASSAIAVAMALLMAGASRHLREPLPEPVHSGDADATRPPSLRRILAVPLVRAVFLYQVLSAMVTQLVEYLLYNRAAVHFSSEQELATFIGRYSAVLNFVDLIVLVTLGGFLMARYGLRYGLSANPAVVAGLVVAAVVVAVASGPEGMLFFGLVAVARIADIATADAAGRTSINATFKALPMRQRVAAQVGVEGAGVPIALGLTALLILAINALPGSDVTEVAVATAVLCAVWCWSAWHVYKRYRSAVVASARRRLLDGQDVDLLEPATRDAVRALLRSDDPRHVKVGARLLAGEGDSESDAILKSAAESRSIEVQRAVIDRLFSLDRPLARQIAGNLIRSPSREHRLDGIRVLGRLAAAEDVAMLQPFLSDGDPGLRAAGAGAMLRTGAGGPAIDALIVGAAGSPSAEDRTFAARVMTEAGTAPSRDVLVALLGDADPGVRGEAGAAVAALNDDQRIRLLAGGMGHHETIRFLRASRFNASPAFCAQVAATLTEGRPETGEMVRLLNAVAWQATGRAEQEMVARLVEKEIEHIAKARTWIEKLSNTDPGLAVSSARLKRALAQEAVASGRRLIDILGLVYDRKLMTRVGRVLQGATPGDAGLALESLDLVLSSQHRSPVAKAFRTAFDPELASRGIAAGNGGDLAKALTELVGNCDWATRMDWLLACVLALMEDARLPKPAMEPAGPISAELLHRSGTAL
jgi:hypothetical protein